MLTRRRVGVGMVASIMWFAAGGAVAHAGPSDAPPPPPPPSVENPDTIFTGYNLDPPNGGENPGSEGGGGAPVSDPCSYTRAEDLATDLLWRVRTLESPLSQETLTTGTWYVKSCPGQPDSGVWVPPTQVTGLPSPFTLAQQAYSSMTVATPPIALNPFYTLEDGRNATLKNIETWVWIDLANWKPVTDRLEVGPVWIEVTAIPRTITVAPNDGVTEPMLCAGPGTPIPPNTPGNEPSPDCSLRFLEQTNGDTWPVTVSVTYSAAWIGSNGVTMVSGELPNVVGAPVTIPLAVLTAKPQLVDPNGD